MQTISASYLKIRISTTLLGKNRDSDVNFSDLQCPQIPIFFSADNVQRGRHKKFQDSNLLQSEITGENKNAVFYLSCICKVS